MYLIIFSPNAKKQFNKLDYYTQERINNSLERIKIKPESYIQKLVGAPWYKFRVGDYRLILSLDKGKLIVLIIAIRHRKNVYDF